MTAIFNIKSPIYIIGKCFTNIIKIKKKNPLLRATQLIKQAQFTSKYT